MRNIRIKIITAAAAILTAATGTTAAAIVTASPAAADVLVNDDAGTIYPGQSLEVGVWYQAYSGGPRGYWEGVYSYPQHRWIFTRSGQASLPCPRVLAGQAARSRPVRHRLRRVPGWPHLPADIPHLEARRAAPVADAGTIVSLCKALLGAAGGSLTPRTMAAAIGMRLGIGQAPVSLDAASLDPGRPEGYPARDSTADAALRESRAVEILALLNDRERVASCLAGVHGP